MLSTQGIWSFISEIFMLVYLGLLVFFCVSYHTVFRFAEDEPSLVQNVSNINQACLDKLFIKWICQSITLNALQ